MPVPDQRDPVLTRARLESWLRSRLPGADGVAVSAVQTPAITGFSAETLMFEASWREPGAGPRQGDMAYYEILSGFKFTVVMARIGQLFIHYGLVPADNDFPYNNTASQLLAKTLGLAPPGGELTTPAF